MALQDYAAWLAGLGQGTWTQYAPTEQFGDLFLGEG